MRAGRSEVDIIEGGNVVDAHTRPAIWGALAGRLRKRDGEKRGDAVIDIAAVLP